MRRFYLIAISISLCLISTAQINPLFIEQTAKQADSLKILAKETSNDTIRMSAFRDLTLYYLDFNSDSALFYIKQELPIVEKLGLKIWKADAYDLYSAVLNSMGNYPESLRMINLALAIANDESTEKNIWHIYKFTNSGNARNARLSMLATILLDKGSLYRSTQDFDKQMQAHQACLKTASLINDFTNITIAQLNLGNLYRDKGMQDSALFFYNQSLKSSEKCGYKKYNSAVYNGLAEIYMKDNKLSEAKQALDSAHILSIQLNNQAELGFCYSWLAQLFSKLNKPDSAIFYGYKAVAVSRKSFQIRPIVKSYIVLASVYGQQKKFDSAYKYLEIAGIVKDSLNSMDKMKQFQNIGFEAQIKLQDLEEEQTKVQNRIRTYGMLGGLFVVMLIALILYRNNRQKQKANKVLERALTNLKSTQSQLIQSEKMASLGELTAGIAHEIQNPLNFVNNFSEVSNELINEMKEELDKGDIEEAKTIAADVKQNLEKINHHGKRAGDIVKGMLQHSRKSEGKKEPTDINALCDEYLRLSYHGLRAKDKSFNAIPIAIGMKTDFDSSLPKISVVPQDIGRVILNLINNAFYVVSTKASDYAKASSDESAKVDSNYVPTVWVSTKKEGNKVLISVRDNGNGIPEKIKDKIFQPFFTTKPTGSGTGLGLSLSYDIVKTHGGEIKVQTKYAEGTEFLILLPVF